MRIPRTLVVLVLATALIAAMNGVVRAAEDALPSWNEGPVKKAVTDFVVRMTREGSPDFVPPAERIAVFDNDGTLWAEQPMYFQLAFALDRVKALAPQHPEWKAKEPFASLLKGDLKGALAGGEGALLEIMAVSHAGMTTEEFEKLVKDWIGTAKHPRFKRPYTEVVYQPMLELLAYLRANGFKTFIVSGGGVEFMRAWVEQVYGIPPEQVVGSMGKQKFELRDGKPVLLKLPAVDFVDDKEGKPIGIQKFIGRRPIFAFGNSDGDLQMLQWTAAGSGPRFMGLVHHTDAEREWAYDRQSPIGRLDRALDEATAKNWVVVDMKNDWKRVFAFEQTSMRAPTSSNSLEGIEWRLVEVSGKPVAMSAGERRPSVTFDAAKKQATGYAGCNRFFGGYELEGTTLKFGAVGATKRACPDLEEGLETEFFKALEATSSWQIKDDTLLWLSGNRVLARFHPPQPQ